MKIINRCRSTINGKVQVFDLNNLQKKKILMKEGTIYRKNIFLMRMNNTILLEEYKDLEGQIFQPEENNNDQEIYNFQENNNNQENNSEQKNDGDQENNNGQENNNDQEKNNDQENNRIEEEAEDWIF